MLDWTAEVKDERSNDVDDADLTRNSAPVLDFAGCQRVEDSRQLDRVIWTWRKRLPGPGLATDLVPAGSRPRILGSIPMTEGAWYGWYASLLADLTAEWFRVARH